MKGAPMATEGCPAQGKDKPAEPTPLQPKPDSESNASAKPVVGEKRKADVAGVETQHPPNKKSKVDAAEPAAKTVATPEPAKTAGAEQEPTPTVASKSEDKPAKPTGASKIVEAPPKDGKPPPKPKPAWSKDEVDKSYYDSYAQLGIHESMLKDKSRTGTYRKAILENAELFKDAVVLDVGAGTGILSYFACDAGAKKVYAVEASNFSRWTQKIAEANGYADKITVIHGRMEDVELPEKVDIIISEWMGYFLVYEAMLDAVIDARDKWLKPGGKLFPDRGQLFVTAYTYPEFFKMHVDWWENVWGKNFTCLKNVAVSHYMRDAQIDCVPPDAVCTEDHLILDLDLNTVTKDEYKSFSTTFKVEGIRTAEVHGIAAWFHVTFPAAENPVPVEDICVDTGLALTNKDTGEPMIANNSPILNIRDAEPGQKYATGVRTIPKDDGTGIKKDTDPPRLSAAEEKRLAKEAIARNHKSLKDFTGTVLSTSPYHEPTHWGHTMFWFNEAVAIKQGQSLVGSLKAEVSQGQHRAVEVYVSWKNHNKPTHQQIRARSFKLG